MKFYLVENYWLLLVFRKRDIPVALGTNALPQSLILGIFSTRFAIFLLENVSNCARLKNQVLNNV